MYYIYISHILVALEKPVYYFASSASIDTTVRLLAYCSIRCFVLCVLLFVVCIACILYVASHHHQLVQLIQPELLHRQRLIMISVLPSKLELVVVICLSVCLPVCLSTYISQCMYVSRDNWRDLATVSHP